MSTLPIIEEIEKSQLKTEGLPQINVGDSVNVSTTIIEGKKKRIQRFEGTIVKIQGALSRMSFTVRRVIDRVGVEKSFLLHSPLVTEIKIVRRGKVRRARLNYLRERVGVRATRVKAKDNAVA